MDFINITSQGQISIPAKIRQILGLEIPGKITYTIKNNRIILEKPKNILELEGILQTKAIKNKSIKEVMRLEKESVKSLRIRNSG